MIQHLPQLLQRLPEKKVLVIGDVMLDHTIKGTVERISPEAPVPVLRVKEEMIALGGAANCARNIAALGAKVTVVGITGNDDYRFTLLNLMRKEGFNVDGIFADVARPTTRKTRFYAGSHHLLRHDHESLAPLSSEMERKVLDYLFMIIPQVEYIVVSDYAKGLLTENMIRQLLSVAQQQNMNVLVDSKPERLQLFKGAHVVTLNVKEARAFANMKGTDQNAHSEIALYIANQMKSNVVITRGGEGMTVCTLQGEVVHIPTTKQEVIDTIGVGDTVTGVLSAMLLLGCTLEDAATIANYAGTLAVTKKGNATITPQELHRFFRLEIHEYLNQSMNVKKAVLETQLDKIEEIAHQIIQTYKNQKKILVFGNGGSAADAQHFAAELVGRYKMERPGLPAIALTTDSSILTAVGNDYGYDEIFARQIEAHSIAGDMVIGITTSGNSKNILRGFEEAKKRGAFTVALTGKDGGLAAKAADISIVVPSEMTSWIQESHIAIIHILCELLEKKLYEQY